MHSFFLSTLCGARPSTAASDVPGIGARLFRQLFARRPIVRRKEIVSTLRLPADSTYALVVGNGVAEVELLEGVVWVTREGDSHDYVLSRKGQVFEGQLCERIVLQPTADSRVSVKVRLRA